MSEKQNKDSIPGPLLTTGDIARYCHASVVQINRWIISGKLKAFRNPGGRHRISKQYFKEFLRQNGMPVIEEFFRDDRHKKILIADDDGTVVEVLQDILLDYFKDIEIKTAKDGYEALITAGSFNPDLLILDMRMPKIDGLEVCRRLRENEGISTNLKILAMTAHSDAYHRDAVLEAGADEYLIKPVDMATFRGYVEKLISNE
jgi:two-component system, OmpR family, response regulator VicR